MSQTHTFHRTRLYKVFLSKNKSKLVMSASKAVDLELIVWNYVRNEYETKFNQINVPMPLKYLIVSLSKQIIGSKLLTVKEDIDFVKLLLTKISKIKRFNLLLRATKDGFQAKDFHNKCDKKNGQTITIIKSNFGNIFGGSITVPWTSDWGFHKDKDAFLFLIRSSNELEQKECPFMFEVKENQVHIMDLYLVMIYGS